MEQIIQSILPCWFYLVSRDEHFSKSRPVNSPHLDIVMKFHSIGVNLLSISHCITSTKQTNKKNTALVSSNCIITPRSTININPSTPLKKSNTENLKQKKNQAK